MSYEFARMRRGILPLPDPDTTATWCAWGERKTLRPNESHLEVGIYTYEAERRSKLHRGEAEQRSALHVALRLLWVISPSLPFRKSDLKRQGQSHASSDNLWRKFRMKHVANFRTDGFAGEHRSSNRGPVLCNTYKPSSCRHPHRLPGVDAVRYGVPTNLHHQVMLTLSHLVLISRPKIYGT